MPTSCRQAQQTPGNSPLAFSSRLRVASWWSTRVGVFTPHWMRGTMATLMARFGANAFVPGRSPKIPHLCSGETDQAMIKNGDSVRLLYPQGGRVVGFVLRGALRASGRALALHSWCASPARHVGIEWLGARRATSYGLTCQRKPLKPPCRVQHCQVLLLKH